MIFFLEIKNQKLEPKSIVARTTLNRQKSLHSKEESVEKKKKKFHRIRVKQETGLEDLTNYSCTKRQKGRKKKELSRSGAWALAFRHWPG